MQAIILAGGFGTRLRPIISDVPKSLAPISGKPFLAYLLDYLKAQGVTHVVLSVHYMYEKIQAYFQNFYNGIYIEYAIEQTPLGTGGAIKHALNFVDKTKPVFVLNGDTFLKVNYLALREVHAGKITMCICPVPNTSRYESVVVGNDHVIAFNERGESRPGLINGGVYLIDPAIFDNWMSSAFSFEKDFLYANIKSLKPRAFVVEDFFIDIGVPEDYKALNNFVNHLR